MVLDKLTGQEHKMRPLQNTPENARRLFDLIKPKDPKFAPAFYQAVRDTLVADNLEQANRIAFGGTTRYRVVTLTGQIIDISGTMSGGGGKAASGAMSSRLAAETVSPDVLRRFQAESDDAERQLEEASRELRDAEVELDRLRRSGPEIDMSLDKLGLEIETGKKRITDLEKRVRDLK